MRHLKIAIAGLGTIGLQVAKAIDNQTISGLVLSGVSANDQNKALEKVKNFSSVPAITPLRRLSDIADIIVECAPARVFSEIAEPAIESGKILLPASVGALLSRIDLVDRATITGAQIIVPTGALIGLDAVRAAAEGEIKTVTLKTRKPPRGLEGAPYLLEHKISIQNLEQPKLIFSGTAREGALGFPANVNVAAALSLAGIGADKTLLEIWADPKINRNIHTILVEADSARFTMTIENIPSAQNPRTGKITALSIIAALRRLTAPLISGT